MPVLRKHGAYFPHWREEGAAYFVTFRLAGSVASVVKEENAFRRRDLLRPAQQMRRKLTLWELDELEDIHFEKLYIKRHDHGACFLKDPRVAKIVADAFMQFEGIRYHMYAWVIMSNHAHIVFRPLPGWDVPAILHSWKGFSARRANQLLGRTGPFWQTEYYDHLIRNEVDLERCIEYTWFNPEKAGIPNSPWRWRRSTREAHTG